MGCLCRIGPPLGTELGCFRAWRWTYLAGECCGLPRILLISRSENGVFSFLSISKLDALRVFPDFSKIRENPGVQGHVGGAS